MLLGGHPSTNYDSALIHDPPILSRLVEALVAAVGYDPTFYSLWDYIGSKPYRIIEGFSPQRGIPTTPTRCEPFYWFSSRLSLEHRHLLFDNTPVRHVGFPVLY